MFNFLFFFLAPYIPERLINFCFKIFSILRGYGYQPSLTKEVQLCLQKIGYAPKLFIEIGVYHGEYVSEVLSKVPLVNCYLFEPSRINFKLLKKKFKRFSQIKLFNFALSRFNRNGKLYFDNKNNIGSFMSSLHKRSFFESKNFEKIKIRRLDKIFNNKTRIIDYVKIDVEGEELNCMHGFGGLIKKIKLIQFEFGGTYIDSRNYFRDVYNYLNNFNFEIYIITPKGLKMITKYTEDLEYFIYSNFIAINKNI